MSQLGVPDFVGSFILTRPLIRVDRLTMMDHKSNLNYFYISNDCVFMTNIKGKALMLISLDFIVGSSD